MTTRCPKCKTEISPFDCAFAKALEEKYQKDSATLTCPKCKVTLEVETETTYRLIERRLS